MQFEWNSKDSVSFGLYKEVIEDKSAQFLIWLEIDNKEASLANLRTGGAEYRFNNFVIKENSENNTITFCPNIAGCPAYFRINSSEPFHMSITRKDGSAGDESTFQAGETKLELNPVGMRVYKVNVEGKEVSGQDNAPEVKKEEQKVQQEESIPEFFGGSFSSASEPPTDSSASKPSNVVNNPIDDANIFTGGFNSENESVAAQEPKPAPQQVNLSEQQTGSTSSGAMPVFADMFPTAGSRQETSSQNVPKPQSPPEEVKEQPAEQNAGFGSPPFDFQQSPSVERSSQPSGSVSGFSVPYVETEGIRERRENVQNLQQDNDRTSQEVEKLEKQIAELESHSRQLSDSKSSLISHLEILQREYDKDYSKFQADIDEIKGRYMVDQSILEFYKDKDLVPIEDLLRQTDELVQRVEEQIRLFVTAQQNKTDEIEKALKVGKKE